MGLTGLTEWHSGSTPTRRFAILSLVATTLSTAALCLVISYYLRKDLLEREWGTTADYTRTQAFNHLTPADFVTPRSTAAEERFRAFYKQTVAMPEIVRVKIYDTTMAVVWSDEPRLIGQRFPDNANLRGAIAGRIMVNIGTEDLRGNFFEGREFPQLVEVYVPIVFPGTSRVAGVVETYKVPAQVFANIRHGQLTVVAITLGGALLLYFSLFWIVRLTARRIDEQNQVLENRSRELEALNTVITAVSRTLDLDRILATAVETVMSVLAVDACHVRVLEPGTDELVLRAHRGRGERFVRERGRIRWQDSPLAREAAARGEYINIPDITADPRGTELYARGEGLRAFAIFPLMSETGPVGLLCVYRRQPAPFAPPELLLLKVLGGQVGVAIEAARLYGEAQERAEQISAANRIASTISSSLSVQQVFDIAAEETAKLLPFDRISIALLDHAGGRIAMLMVKGAGPPEVTEGSTRPLAGSAVAFTLAKGEPCFREDILALPEGERFPEDTYLAQAGLRSWVAVPLVAKEKALGTFNLCSATPEAFAPKDLPLLLPIARQLAIAIENARLFGEARSTGERLRRLTELSRAVTASLDPQAVLESIVRVSVELLRGDAATLAVVDPATGLLTQRADYGLPRGEKRQTRTFRPGEGVSGRLLASQVPLVVEDFRTDPRVVNREWAAAEGVVAYAGVPLLLGDRAMGTLAVFTRAPRHFTPAEVDLLASLGSHAAIALENARLFAEVSRGRREWKNTFDTVPDLIYVEDSDHRVLRANKAFADWAALPFSQIIGARCHEFFPGSDLLCLKRPQDEPAARSAPSAHEVRDPRTGKIYWVTTSPGGNHEGATCCFVHVARDITNIRQAEEQLQTQNRELLALYEQVERDRGTKATLLKELNHRVRNNMAAIVGLLEMERGRAGVRTAEEALSAALERVKAIARAHELLTAGDFASLDLRGIIEAVAGGVTQGEEGTPRIEVAIHGPSLKVPPKQFVALACIVNELLVNAAKHAFRGRARGRIEVRAGEEDGHYFVEVRDNGVGFGEGGRARRGIGLEIIATLCRADLNGECAFREDGGTVAHVTFPKPAPEARGGK